MDALGHLQLALRRLHAHLAHVRDGDSLAVLDLANILQMLVGDGKGHHLFVRGFNAAGVDLSAMELPGFVDDRLPTQIRNRNAKLIVRPTYEDPDRIDSIGAPGCALPRTVTLKEFVRQERLRSSGLWSQDFDLNLLSIIAKMRNRLTAHADEGNLDPWFSDTRFYIGGLDVLGLILWSAGEALLEASARAMIAAGIAVPPYRRHRDLDGVEIGQIEFFDDLNATIFMSIAQPRRYPRSVLGMAANGRGFMMGVGPADSAGESTIRVLPGRDFENMRDLHARFVSNAGAADQVESSRMPVGWTRLDFTYT